MANDLKTSNVCVVLFPTCYSFFLSLRSKYLSQNLFILPHSRLTYFEGIKTFIIVAFMLYLCSGLNI